MAKVSLTNTYKKYQAYKDSEVEWLGDVPVEWDTTRAKNVFIKNNRPVREDEDIVTAFRDGTVTLRKNRREDGFTFAQQEIGYQGVRKGDLVIHGMDAFAGAIGVSDSDGKSSPVYSVCTPRIGADPKFHMYLLRHMSRSGYLTAIARGIRERSTEFKWPQYGNMFVINPPKGEQEKIAKFLDEQTARIDESISKKQRLIEVLNEKIYGLVIGFPEEVEKINKGLWTYSKKGWKFEKAKWIFNEINEKGFVDHVLLAVTQDRGVLPKSECQENFVSPQNLEGLKLVQKGDFVISLRSFQGGIEYSEHTGLVSPAYTVLRLNSKYNDASYRLYYSYLLKTPQFIGMLNTAISGIRDGKNINYSDFKDLQIPIPDTKSRVEIVELDSKLKTLKKSYERSKGLLEEFKSSLISHAVTGKIKV